jgi:hypothetical protein
MRIKTARPETSAIHGPQYKIRLILLSLFTLVTIMSCIMSCDDDDIDPVQEASKPLDGSWQIVQVFRNEVDMTESIDVSKFRLNFSTDGTYTIDNYLPFVVRSNGKFSLDDPQYPFKIIFREDAMQEAVSIGFTYPVVLGKRQIHLTFSPGCVNNKYEYVLEEAQ